MASCLASLVGVVWPVLLKVAAEHQPQTHTVTVATGMLTVAYDP